MEVKNQWADLNALVEEAKVFYLNNPLPDARKAAVILEPIFECLSHQKEYRQMAVYKLESSIEDCEIKPVPQLQILEYIFRKLKWYEGFRLLEQLHNLHQESDIGFKIEQIIQRIYDPNWSGGISRLVGDVPPGVWNLIEEEHTEQE